MSDSCTTIGIWSKTTFRWLNPILKKGRCEELELEDVQPIPILETPNQAYALLEESLRKQKTPEVPSIPQLETNEASPLLEKSLSKSVSLRKALLSAIWRPLAINAFFAGMNTIASYISPLLIRSFVKFLLAEDENSQWYWGMILAVIFFTAKTIESLSQRQWLFGASSIGIKVQAALMALIYKKSLSIKYGGLSTGEIINCISVDVARIGDFGLYIHGIWLIPVQVLAAHIMLYMNLGVVPSLTAAFTTLVVMACNIPLAYMQQSFQTKMMEAKDSRMKATSETLKSMRVLKLHSWESTFLNKLLQLRETERGPLKKYLYTSSAAAFIFWASPMLVSVVTFCACIVFDTPLTTGTLLSTLVIFRILQEPMSKLSELISTITQTKVSEARVQDFIMCEDQIELDHHDTPCAPGVAIEIEDGEYSWQSRDARRPSLKITEKLKIMKGSKVAICGSVGSGKTSFLCSIIDEMPRISGQRIKIYGSKAFVPQSAWLQTGTVQDNVLFHKPMNIALYNKVLAACALDKDIQIWAGGDLYVVGERGLNCSGGQKQRIQMARALYSNADVYLLDDPFSALDSQTGTQVYEDCLLELLREKTVVYVTHQLEFLRASDLVLVMQNGSVVESGTYEDLISNPDGELVSQMAAHSKSLNEVTPPNYTGSSKSFHQTEITEASSVELSSSSRVSGRNPQEETESGRVKWQAYTTFITSAYKGALVPLTILCHILFQLLQMLSNYWISSESENVTRKHLIVIFALLSGGSSIFVLGRAILLSTIAIETAQRLFLGMINSVFRAPLSFFDSTPSSRILDRSSTDQSTVDTYIPYRLAGLVFAVIQLLSIVVLVSKVVWPIFFLFLIVFAVSMWYQEYYITTARQLARMVPIQQAPILQHFSESVSGATIIRTFNLEEQFRKLNFNLIANYSRVALYNSGTMEWLCVRINFLFNLVFFLLLVILVNLPRSIIDPKMAGLAATYALDLNVFQAWAVWNLCNVRNKMISVERILQFSSIPSEAPLHIEDSTLRTNWLRDGCIEVHNLYIKYNRDLPSVLKGVTCTFPSKQKIGIVGRTGSGKSTLIQALFRVIEPSEGFIKIDGKDISTLGLQELRSQLSIVPQQPILFEGTLRKNLDPLQEHSDHEIWEVVRKCHLVEILNQDERLLDAPVAMGGESWSVGQSQLVCLARALLQRRTILVLDEATASVDTATDDFIQKTIREETNDCTVLTVAHRIPTIVDSDLVLVLGEGKVLEFDSPGKLTKDENSAFFHLVTEFSRRSSTKYNREG